MKLKKLKTNICKIYFKNKIKFQKHRIEILAACRGAGAKEVKRTAVVCHQNFQEISGIDTTNTKNFQEIQGVF